jgi:hypothetical protein
VKRTAGALAALIFSGCMHVESTTRVERGPLLGQTHRAQVLEGDVKGALSVEWPSLVVTITGADTCRDLTVEEYAEDHITERTSAAAGPALSTGISTILAGAALYGVSFLVSGSPNTQVIDASGHYGASTRQVLQGWSVVLGGVGVPAVIVGLVTSLKTGEDVRTERVEQVVSQRDEVCHQRPLVGPVVLRAGAVQGPERLTAADGLVRFAPPELPGPVDQVLFAGRKVTLDAEGQAALDGYVACAGLEAPPGPLAELDERALVARIDLLHRCHAVRGAAVDASVASAEAELTRRRQPVREGPRFESYEEALRTVKPGLRLTRTSSQWEHPGSLDGETAQLEAVVAERTADHLVLQVGAHRVVLSLPAQPSWPERFEAGTRVEVVAHFEGQETLGREVLPRARALWVRGAW